MIVYEPAKELCEWANKGIFGFGVWDEKSKAIGQIIDGKLVSVVTYADFKHTPRRGFYSCEMGIFSIDKRWCNRHYLRAVFHYPFICLSAERVQTVCSSEDEGVIMFNQKLGFKKEGVHRKAWHTGQDAISWSMLREECKWL